MSERLSDVKARIGSVRQLSAVISAMRGIAAARAREASGELDGVRAYADTIAGAIGRALSFLPEGQAPEAGRDGGGQRAVVALCAEEGFAGAFSEHVLEGAAALLSGRSGELLIVGDRGLIAAAERGLEVSWSTPMIIHVGQASDVASRIVDEVYRRVESDRVHEIFVVHAGTGSSGTAPLCQNRLVPFDFGQFPAVGGGSAPLMTLSPEALLARLAEEYVFAEICEALVLSFSAENEARLRAMIAAKSNVENVLDDLVARSRRLRQEEITNEILELAEGALS